MATTKSKTQENGRADNPLEYTHPLAEVSATDQATQIDGMITQRQHSLVQAEALLKVTQQMPDDVKTDQTERDREANERDVKQLTAAIRILRAHKKSLLEGRK